MLQCELLQDDFQPPPMVDSGPFVTRSFFLRGPVISCTRPVVPPSSSSGWRRRLHVFSAPGAAACVDEFAQLAQLDAHDAALLRRVLQAQCRPGTGIPSTGEPRVDCASGGESGLCYCALRLRPVSRFCFFNWRLEPAPPAWLVRAPDQIGKVRGSIPGIVRFSELFDSRNCSGRRFRPSVCEAVGAINAQSSSQ